MNATDPKGKESRGATALRDTAEARAVVVTFVALALFVYLVGLIVLPFVIAGIIAYICTPLLDWLARRTRLPRALLAALLFVLLIGTAAFTVAFVAWSLISPLSRQIQADFKLDNTTVGLLIAIPPEHTASFEDALSAEPFRPRRIGTITGRGSIRVIG